MVRVDTKIKTLDIMTKMSKVVHYAKHLSISRGVVNFRGFELARVVSYRFECCLAGTVSYALIQYTPKSLSRSVGVQLKRLVASVIDYVQHRCTTHGILQRIKRSLFAI